MLKCLEQVFFLNCGIDQQIARAFNIKYWDKKLGIKIIKKWFTLFKPFLYFISIR
jgi:hypothetical protein